MGKRGPKKQPPPVKLAKGTHRQDRDNALSVNADLPKVPSWLSKEATVVWHNVVAELSKLPGLLESVDGFMLSRYCQDWVDYWAAHAVIEAEGIIAISEKGSMYQHPAVGIKNKANERMAKFEARFCMSPCDRAGVSLSTEIPNDPAAEFLA